VTRVSTLSNHGAVNFNEQKSVETPLIYIAGKSEIKLPHSSGIPKNLRTSGSNIDLIDDPGFYGCNHFPDI
jgi:hypothetical protein